jgi:preprotein translocase subunit SecE
MHIRYTNRLLEEYKSGSSIIFMFGGYGIMSKLIGFLKNVGSEMRKVSWPKRKELTRYTIVVLSTVVFMAVYFGLIDLGISRVMEWYLAL